MARKKKNEMLDLNERLKVYTKECKKEKAIVQNLREEYKKNTENILHCIMPVKVLRLQKLLEETPEIMPIARDGYFDHSQQNVLPSSNCVRDLLCVVKQEILELLNHLSSIKTWLQLNVPRIEDGNNFGVEVQEEIIDVLSGGKISALSVLEMSCKYFIVRGRVIQKIQKYPCVDSFRYSLHNVDEREWTSLRNCVLHLRDNYSVLHDLLRKNIEKLKNPRGTHQPRNFLY